MTKDFVTIIDYGSGNLRSAAKAFERVIADHDLPLDVLISSAPEDVLNASHIILPGQGAFKDCMDGLRAVPGMVDALEHAVLQKGTPFLGICVGMQLMADEGLEHGSTKGLGWIPGKVVAMDDANGITDQGLKIPHMGWNTLVYPQGHGAKKAQHFVLRSAESSSQTEEHYYFVHSFMFESEEGKNILACTEYGGLVPAVIGRDNMIGVQFHPEKSQAAGLELVRRFLRWNP